MFFGLWFNIIVSKQLLKEWLCSCTTKAFLLLGIVKLCRNKARDAIYNEQEVSRPFTEYLCIIYWNNVSFSRWSLFTLPAVPQGIERAEMLNKNKIKKKKDWKVKKNEIRHKWNTTLIILECPFNPCAWFVGTCPRITCIHHQWHLGGHGNSGFSFITVHKIDSLLCLLLLVTWFDGVIYEHFSLFFFSLELKYNACQCCS